MLLYDADRIEEAASTEHETDLYERQCDVFLNPNDPAVIEEALKQGIPQNVIDAAQRSPVYKMAMDWKLALPLHPEYRTLPMVWYVPPLSPIQSYADAGGLPQSDGVLPAVESLRIPVQYGKHAQRGRYRSGAARPEAHDGDAPLQAFPDRGRRDRHPRHRRGRPDGRTGRRDVSLPRRLPTTKTAS